MSDSKNMIIIARLMNTYYQKTSGLKCLDLLMMTEAITNDLENSVKDKDIKNPEFFQFFSNQWPDDLDWPSDIKRPEPRKEAA